MLSNNPVAKGTVTYGTHGATSSLSANGTSDGILWEVETTNTGSGPAILHAYNATNVHNELYNSSQAGSRDTAGTAVKFTVPTIADGHVFVRHRQRDRHLRIAISAVISAKLRSSGMS